MDMFMVMNMESQEPETGHTHLDGDPGTESIANSLELHVQAQKLTLGETSPAPEENSLLNDKLKALLNSHPELLSTVSSGQLLLLGIQSKDPTNSARATLLSELCQITSEEVSKSTLDMQQSFPATPTPPSLHELLMILQAALTYYNNEIDKHKLEQQLPVPLNQDVLDVGQKLIHYVPTHLDVDSKETMFIVLNLIDTIFDLVDKAGKDVLIGSMENSLVNTCTNVFKDRKFHGVIRSYLEKVHTNQDNKDEWLNILCKTILQIIGKLDKDKDSTTIISLLSIYMEFYTKEGIMDFLTWEEISKMLLSLVLHGLLSPSIQSRKESVYLVKTLIGILISLDKKKLASLSATFGHKFLLLELKKNVNTFWEDYFSLLEILDEKQSHIIEPYLGKFDSLLKMSLQMKNPKDSIPWIHVIIHKMINHDNRIIVETGINNFFEAGLKGSWPSEGDRSEYLQFLKVNIIPVLKKHVGTWIFSEGQQIFQKSTEFGAILQFLFDGVDYEKLRAWKFITDELLLDRGLNPYSLFFFMDSLRVCFEMDGNLKLSLHEIGAVLKSMFKILYYASSSGVDRYIGNLIEDTLFQIFAFFMRSGRLDQIFSEYFVPVLEFIGRLSRSIFIEQLFINLGSFLLNYKFLDQLKALSWNYEDTPLNRGMGRLIFIAFIVNKTPVFPSEEPIAYLQLLTANPSEFLQCLIAFDPEEISLSQCQERFVSMLMIQLYGEYIQSPTQDDYFKLMFHEVISVWYATEKSESDLHTLRDTLQSIIQIHHPLDTPYGPSHHDFQKFPLQLLHFVMKYNDRLQIPLTLSLADIQSIADNLETQNSDGIRSTLELFALPLIIKTIRKEIGDEAAWLQFHSDFANSCWKYIFEKKSPEFLLTLRMFFNYILLLPEPYPKFTESWKTLFKEYSDRVFDDDGRTPGVQPIFMESIFSSKLIRNLSSSGKLVIESGILDACIRGTYFGNAIQRQNRASFSILDFFNLGSKEIDGISLSALVKPYLHPDFLLTGNARARLQAIHICELIIMSAGENRKEIVKKIVTHLLDRSENESKLHKRYYENSSTHRIKHRIAQALLVLQPLYDREMATHVNERVLNALTDECPQPSIRYFLEWVIMKNLVQYPDLCNGFFLTVKELCKRRQGFGAFVSTICVHVCLKLDPNADITKKFFKNSFKILISFLLGPHVVTKVYACMAFQKLHSYITKSKSLRKIGLSEYNVIYESLVERSSTSYGNFNKLIDGVQGDFWLNHFDPISDFNWTMIFLEFPKISRISSDEIVQKHHLVDFKHSILAKGYFKSSECIPWKSKNNFFASNSFYTLKSDAGIGREMGEIEPMLLNASATSSSNVPNANGNGQANLQKKINPWKILPVSEGLSDFSQEIQKMKNPVDFDDGLIVVASLIDRIPNLGGLCRTAEIFNVSSYVVSSLNILSDQQFKSCSVSAEKWVNIIETPVRDLETFLRNYSTKGYHILGIEQAESSVPLNNYKFPKKSILLLGNEKSGIPTKLLHLVDQCLEIPQVGVIRSLNVHVTGSLCIWQYAMQHVI